MGLFDKLKKKAQEQIESAGMSDILQSQKDAFKYTMKNGGFSLLGSDREEKLAAFRAQEEAEKKAKEDAKRLELERIEAERLAKIEAERKAKEEADRMVVEEARRKAEAAAEARAIEEAERLAKIESERRIQEEMDRKAIEEAQRRIKAQADLRALEETERKLKEEEKQQRLAEAQKQQEKVLDPIREFVEKAESGDAQAACQIGLWFQHGQKGLPCDLEQAKYWYQQAMVLGNPNAASFLNMLMEEEKKVAAIKAQEEAEHKAQEEAARQKQEEENRKRLMYNSEDEYLACEKNDGEAALRVATLLRKKARVPEGHATIDLLQKNIKLLNTSLKYLSIAKSYFPYGQSQEFRSLTPEGMDLEIDLVNSNRDSHEALLEALQEKKKRDDAIKELSDGFAQMWEDTFREVDDEMEKWKKENMEAKKQEQNIVTVVFRYETGDWNNGTQDYYTHNQKREKKMPKEEYYSLIQSGEKYLESYVNNTFEDGKRDYCHKVSLSIE